jgi:hypothetical protein
MSTNPTGAFYLGLDDSARMAVHQSTVDPAELGRAQDRIQDLSHWRALLTDHPDNIVYQHALNEVTVGLFLLASGLYRPAFVSLRLFLELSLASVHFSVNRLELAEWLDGRRDVKWVTLADPENGVLSIRYCQAFFPELSETAPMYNAIACKIYRELSEFVHGNNHTWGIITDQIAFDRDLNHRWLRAFDEASTTVVYALCLRFLKELDKDDLAAVSAIVGYCVEHVESIRDYLAGAK